MPLAWKARPGTPQTRQAAWSEFEDNCPGSPYRSEAMHDYNSQWIVWCGWIIGWILLWRVPRLSRDQPDRLMGPVTIVIPARNEAHRLPGLLESLTDGLPATAQVIVVDDHSVDGTAEVARCYPGVHLLTAPNLPAGWTGKIWACHAVATIHR
jgi:hypothetical protein